MVLIRLLRPFRNSFFVEGEHRVRLFPLEFSVCAFSPLGHNRSVKRAQGGHHLFCPFSSSPCSFPNLDDRWVQFVERGALGQLIRKQCVSTFQWRVVCIPACNSLIVLAETLYTRQALLGQRSGSVEHVTFYIMSTSHGSEPTFSRNGGSFITRNREFPPSVPKRSLAPSDWVRTSWIFNATLGSFQFLAWICNSTTFLLPRRTSAIHLPAPYNILLCVKL